jgi:hypothetical protein
MYFFALFLVQGGKWTGYGLSRSSDNTISAFVGCVIFSEQQYLVMETLGRPLECLFACMWLQIFF